MNVVFLSAGSGSMYCGACARDAALASGLLKLGHNAVVIPLYTPLRFEEESALSIRPIRFGGINAYLREVVPGYRKWPRMIQALFDHPKVLAWASRFAVKTDAAKLGPMTVSMLQGSSGKHAGAIADVAGSVAKERPDLVIIANSMLACVTPALRDAGVPRVVCQVQGEDGFLDELREPWRAQARELLQHHVAGIDRFLAPSASHASEMSDRLGITVDRFDILPHPAPDNDALPFPEGPPTIGHISSLRRAKGLDILIRAMEFLPENVCVVAGGRDLEPPFHREIRNIAAPFGERVRILGEVRPADKAAFFTGVDVVALPSRLRESRGLAALESLSFGRPVVGSDAGIFAELGTMTEGVILHRPEDPEDLARALRVCLDRAEAARLGCLGREMVRRDFAPDHLALRAEALFQAILG